MSPANWDVAILQQMTRAFTTADIGKKIKAAIKQAGQLINLHLDKSGTKFSSKLQYKELYSCIWRLRFCSLISCTRRIK